MRALIVDDERPARQRLRRLLEAFDDVEVVGESGDGRQALDDVAALAPDILFVDIRMPGIGGLDLVASLPDPAPAVVFVTAYDQYAVSAFDAAALDYLLKPVEAGRLAEAVRRGRARPPAEPSARGTALAPRQLVIPDRDRLIVVPVADIVWLEAADNYVVVHTCQGSPLMRRTLAGLVDDLGPVVVRTHRSAAVACAHVAGVTGRGSGDGTVHLRNGATAPCSRHYRAELLARLG